MSRQSEQPQPPEAERIATVDAMNRCRYCARKFNPQGLKGHERFCPKRP